MSLIAIITLSPHVSGQFGMIINAVVNMVVLAYAAAGLSLVVGTRERRPNFRDRLLGIGALVACALLFASSSVAMMLGSLAAMGLAWIVYRIFGRRG
jgi:arginine:agmatine antiporter